MSLKESKEGYRRGLGGSREEKKCNFAISKPKGEFQRTISPLKCALRPQAMLVHSVLLEAQLLCFLEEFKSCSIIFCSLTHSSLIPDVTTFADMPSPRSHSLLDSFSARAEMCRSLQQPWLNPEILTIEIKYLSTTSY